MPLVYLGVRAVLLPRAPEVAEQGGSFGVRDTVAVVRDDDAAEPAEVVAAMKVETDSLAHVDPFKLLNRGLPSGKFSVGSQTLAVIGATFGGGRIGTDLGRTHVYPITVPTYCHEPLPHNPLRCTVRR